MTCMLLCSCSASETGAPSETALNTAGASLSPLNTQPSGQEAADPYNEPAGINLLVAVDQFGRTVPVSGAHKENRAVGMMYWLWHGSYTSRGWITLYIICRNIIPRAFLIIGENRFTAITVRTTNI